MLRITVCSLVALSLVAGSLLAGEKPATDAQVGTVTKLDQDKKQFWWRHRDKRSSILLTVTKDTRYFDRDGKTELTQADLWKQVQRGTVVTVWADAKGNLSKVKMGY